MYRERNISQPGILRFRPTPAEQYYAIQRLVRPKEVKHLFRRRRRRYGRRRVSSAALIAGWLRRCLNTGVLRYIPDPASPRDVDYWRSPQNTLRRSGGDCEDLSILAVSMLLIKRVTAYMVTGEVWTGDDYEGHAWVEGRDERGFFLIEATSGELYRYRPEEYEPELLLGLGVFQRAA